MHKHYVKVQKYWGCTEGISFIGRLALLYTIYANIFPHDVYIPRLRRLPGTEERKKKGEKHVFPLRGGGGGEGGREEVEEEEEEEGEREKNAEVNVGYVHFAQLTSCERRRVPAGDGPPSARKTSAAPRTHTSAGPRARASTRRREGGASPARRITASTHN